MARSAAKGHCDRVLRYVAGGVFMESGFCQILGRLEYFGTGIHYTREMIDDLAAVEAGAPSAWLDWLSFGLRSTSREYIPGMESLAMNTDERAYQFTTGNYSTHSGKTLLFWQALAGTRQVKKSEYDGETIP